MVSSEQMKGSLVSLYQPSEVLVRGHIDRLSTPGNKLIPFIVARAMQERHDQLQALLINTQGGEILSQAEMNRED